MTSRALRYGLPPLAASLSLVATLGSLYYVRDSGEIVKWCDDGCEGPIRTAGLPFGYVYDAVGVSIEGSIGFEDDIRWGLMLINLAFFFALFYLGGMLASRTMSNKQTFNEEPVVQVPYLLSDTETPNETD